MVAWVNGYTTHDDYCKAVISVQPSISKQSRTEYKMFTIIALLIVSATDGSEYC